MGIPVAMVEAKKREILARQANRNERDKIAATIDSTVSQVNGNYQAFVEIGATFLNWETWNLVLYAQKLTLPDIRLKEGLAKYNVNDDNYGKDRKKSRSRSRSKSRSKRAKKSKSRERKKR